jgi:hypothetical protein
VITQQQLNQNLDLYSVLRQALLIQVYLMLVYLNIHNTISYTNYSLRQTTDYSITVDFSFLVNEFDKYTIPPIIFTCTGMTPEKKTFGDHSSLSLQLELRSAEAVYLFLCKKP